MSEHDATTCVDPPLYNGRADRSSDAQRGDVVTVDDDVRLARVGVLLEKQERQSHAGAHVPMASMRGMRGVRDVRLTSWHVGAVEVTVDVGDVRSVDRVDGEAPLRPESKGAAPLLQASPGVLALFAGRHRLPAGSLAWLPEPVDLLGVLRLEVSVEVPHLESPDRDVPVGVANGRHVPGAYEGIDRSRRRASIAVSPRRGKSVRMPIMGPHHDLAHEVGPEDAWSESYYFNAYDPPSDSGLFTRIGIRPNEGTMDVGFSVWLPGGELAEYRHQVACDAMPSAPLEVGCVRYELVEPLRAWRLVADLDATARPCVRSSAPTRTVRIGVDVTFEAISPAVGTDGQRSTGGSEASRAAASTTGKGHLEQAGRYRGALCADGIRHAWTDARGNRDRSWGPRRWNEPSMWRWFSINVGDALHLGGIRLGTAAGDLHRGWVSADGHVASIRDWDVRTEVADDGLTQRVIHLRATDKQDRSYDLTGRVLRVADIGRAGGTVVNEGLTEWTHHRADGTDEVGYGIGEYLHQLDASGRPRVPVA